MVELIENYCYQTLILARDDPVGFLFEQEVFTHLRGTFTPERFVNDWTY
jgi:hypothetical protein